MRLLPFGPSLLLALLPAAAFAGFSFPSIDGGTIDLDDFRGRPVLVVNTASLCGFAPQFDDLQALHEEYADRGLVVLAVPSDDFRQELASGEQVKEFCAVNFDLTIPMTDITRVMGDQAHPFYKWLAPLSPGSCVKKCATLEISSLIFAASSVVAGRICA